MKKEDGIYAMRFASQQMLIDKLQEEKKQLKEQLLVTQTNEETYRLEMADITKTLGLDENTLFDDVKACAKSLKDNWDKLKEQVINRFNRAQDVQFLDILQDMQELEQRNDSNKNE